MKLLLKKSISRLGIVGDVVDVKPGYARNYLLPQGLAVQPSETNMRALAEDRRQAEGERAAHRARLTSLAEQLATVDVTVEARANEDGVLYGSVGRREIAAALQAEGHDVTPEQVALSEPIRRLDNVEVEVQLLDDIRASVKVWVVRERSSDDGEESKETTGSADDHAGTEAGGDGDHADQ